MTLISTQIITRETQRVACNLGLTKFYDLSVSIDIQGPLGCIYISTYDYVINFKSHSLELNLEEFSKHIITPGLHKLLSIEQRFILEDYS